MADSNSTSDRLLDGALSNIKKMSEYIETGHQEVMTVGMELLENTEPGKPIKM